MVSREIRKSNPYPWIWFFAFIACVPSANWLIANVGSECVPNGPCLIPVWPGVMAPSGVLLAGLSFALRDLVQEFLGIKWAAVAVMIGGVVAALITSPELAIASVVAFLMSELLDMLTFTIMRIRGQNLVYASVGSSVLGLVLDSVLFVYIAFGTTDYILGQSIGKAWMVALTIPFLLTIRRVNSPAR